MGLHYKGFNTAAAKSMNSMFYGASPFNQPIGGFSTAAVTDMVIMFAYATVFNQPIEGFDTAAAKSKMNE